MSLKHFISKEAEILFYFRNKMLANLPLTPGPTTWSFKADTELRNSPIHKIHYHNNNLIF